MLAMGCPLSQLSAKLTVEASSWSVAGADLAEKCTEEAEKIREKYGSLEKIRDYYENLYRNGDQRMDLEVLMCIDMMLGNYERALKLISEAQLNLNLDTDHSIWGYAARYARKMLAARMSSSIH
jgi:tetratricopeptide (TPR) repeat protein